MIDLVSLFEKYGDEYLEFQSVENRYSNRPDLHAFNLLDTLLPGHTDIVSAAGHGEIWLEVDALELAEVATEEQILELIRCGVRYNKEYELLAMFV